MDENTKKLIGKGLKLVGQLLEKDISNREIVQCWLAEFEGLRNLVLNFQRMQHNLIWVNISIMGAFLAIYFSYWQDKPDMTLFLAIPIVSSLLGVYWVAQGRQTSQIGYYIKNKIAPALQTLCNDQKVMMWEDYIREGMGTRFSIYARDLVSLRVPRSIGGLTFLVTFMAALIITAISLGRTFVSCYEWQIASVWWVGLILTLWLIISGYKLGQYWIKAGK
ncbi:MAG: hypothetical protein AMJ70_04375 [Dehalococcoidia bacterium SG8_51_3]|nr:MAG: hypothetical protein AMJ70_04375 [Dehalococcoidia bacterium SG8_51_3]